MAIMNDIGKGTAINQLNKGPTIKLLGESNIDDVISEATMFLDKCYGCLLRSVEGSPQLEAKL